MGRQTIKAQ